MGVTESLYESLHQCLDCCHGRSSGWAYARYAASGNCEWSSFFLEQINSTLWIFGNDLWNITQGPVYATKLYYDGSDAIGTAVGHYVGWDGENNLRWTSANITSRGTNYVEISFNAGKGGFHWVVFDDLAGAYQYFVNKPLPDISVLRSLNRFDPIRFTNGRTYLKDEPLPEFALYANATKMQDETWQLANGTFITKYDW